MFSAGQQFGNYILIERLGRGGFGEVWLAERRTKFAATQVAVKLPLDEQVDHAAIEQEAQLWARASGHSNVLPIIEANEYDGQILIVSEYAPDGSLEALLKKNGGALPMKQAVELTIGILKGLEFLHSRKIIHRDIKPGNILLQGDTPRMADFSISRVLKTTSHATNVVGTPCYMAPETFRRIRNAQTDVWSVGVMLYQMLKGELPFSGDNITDLYGAIAMSEPEPLPDSIPSKLKKIVWKALSKDKAGRYQTARAMREELDEFWMRLPHPVAAQTQESVASKKVDDQLTLEIPVSPPDPVKQPGEIERQVIMREIRPVSSPILPKVKIKTNRLYFAIPAVVLLIIISVVYFLKKRMPINTAPSNNTNTSLVAEAASAEATGKLLIPFRKGDKWGFSDVNKKVVIGAKYDYADLFRGGLAFVKLNDKFGFIDNTGKEVVPLKYDLAFPFSGGLAIVKLNGKFGFIDNMGKEVIPLKYDNAFVFSEGLACVVLNSKYGFIDNMGKEVIPLKYDFAFSFGEGLARVMLNNKWFYIDKNGTEYYEP